MICTVIATISFGALADCSIAKEDTGKEIVSAQAEKESIQIKQAYYKNVNIDKSEKQKYIYKGGENCQSKAFPKR